MNTRFTKFSVPIKAQVSLDGIDGNAFSVMGSVERGLKRAGATHEYIEAFREEATSGDYEHLVAVAQAYTEEPEEGDEDE